MRGKPRNRSTTQFKADWLMKWEVGLLMPRYGASWGLQLRPKDGNIQHMQQVSGCPNNLRLGNGAAEGTCPRGAAVACHGHVGDPVFLGRDIRRPGLHCQRHPVVPLGLKPRHIGMWAYRDSP